MIESCRENLERSWNNSRDHIFVHAYISFSVFCRSISLFRVKKVWSPIFLLQSVFQMHIFGPCHCLNEGCKWVAMAQMCMQHIWNATHIWTLMKLTITMWKYLDYPCSKWSQNSQIFLFEIGLYKFHSWQCIRLTIPSSRVNVAIGEFKHIICLKMIFGEDICLQLPKVWVQNLFTSIQNA